MSGFGFTLVGIIHGGVDCGEVGSGAGWAIEVHAIICCVLGRGRDYTTHIMSSIHLIVGDIEKDW